LYFGREIIIVRQGVQYFVQRWASQGGRQPFQFPADLAHVFLEFRRHRWQAAT
jgi:hypothetical protein